MIRAGDLDRRISLQRSERAPYDLTAPAWATYATVAAAVRQASGREYLSAAAVVAERRVVFVIRWRSDILVTDRIAFAGAPFNIREVREIGRREGLELHAEALA